MAEFGDDRVHHHPAVGIVLDAENLERLCLRQRAVCRGAGRGRAGAVEHHVEVERAAAAGRALDREIAVHGAGEAAHLHQAEPGAAEPLGDLLARLRERPEQPGDLGVAHADPAVGNGERQGQLAARQRRCLDAQADLAALGELHRIRHQVFDRGAQQRRIAGHMVRQIANVRLAGKSLRLGARGEREREPRGEARQREDLAAQLEASFAGPRRLDRERGQLGEMPGRDP